MSRLPILLAALIMPACHSPGMTGQEQPPLPIQQWRIQSENGSMIIGLEVATTPDEQAIGLMH